MPRLVVDVSEVNAFSLSPSAGVVIGMGVAVLLLLLAVILALLVKRQVSLSFLLSSTIINNYHSHVHFQEKL